MKQGKQISTKNRIIRNVIYFLLSGLAGGLMGFFGVMYHDRGLSLAIGLEHILFFTRIMNVIIFAMAFYFGISAKAVHKIYQESDVQDDDLIDDLYKKMYRNLEYATILFNIAASMTILNLGLGFQMNFSKFKGFIAFGSIDLGLLLLLLISQPLILKLTQKIREYKLSAFATVKEMKDFVDAMDEGEKQANYEISFQIIFSLNQIILPGLYVALFFLSLILKEPQVIGYAIVAFIHIYINIMSIKMIRQYFK